MDWISKANKQGRCPFCMAVITRQRPTLICTPTTTPPPPPQPPPTASFFSFPFSEIGSERDEKLQFGRKSWEKKRSRGDDTPSCCGSPFIGVIKGSIKARSVCWDFLFFFFFFFVNWMRLLRVIVRSRSPERRLEEWGVVSQHNKYSYLLLSL